ncbi:MAG: hypothetical protein IJ752_09505 [Alphaproteobacteria bacterium]|nr:hypothetical protein [Alphaproteobacteria bacterium]
MINTLTLLSLIKPAVLFICDLKRLAYLITVPAAALIVVAALVYFYPPFYLAETIQPNVEFNIYILLLIVVFLPFLFASVMLRVQQILFFGEDQEQKRRFFLPKPDKAMRHYIAVCLQVVLYSLFLSALLSLILIVIVNHFLPLSERAGLLFIIGTLVFCPYFLVRFILKLPAAAADRSLRWWTAWQMTSGINVVVAVVQISFLIFPLIALFSINMMLQRILGNTQFMLFTANFSMIFAALLACILHAAYCGYLFSSLISKD